MQSIHNVRSSEVYTCNYCNAPYHNLYSLHEHMRAVHQNQPCTDIKYPCTLCSRHFSSIESLSIHKKVAHYKEKSTSGSSTSSAGSDGLLSCVRADCTNCDLVRYNNYKCTLHLIARCEYSACAIQELLMNQNRCRNSRDKSTCLY
jgi:hypothetical protein